jgi:hypothetical protein
MQCQAQHLLGIGKERRAVDRTVEHRRRHQPVLPQILEKGRRVPVSVGDRRHQALAARRLAMAACHVRGGPDPVEEDQPRRIEFWSQNAPGGACFGNFRRILLCRTEPFISTSSSAVAVSPTSLDGSPQL